MHFIEHDSTLVGIPTYGLPADGTAAPMPHCKFLEAAKRSRHAGMLLRTSSVSASRGVPLGTVVESTITTEGNTPCPVATHVRGFFFGAFALLRANAY
jgi:hypothetical protein